MMVQRFRLRSRPLAAPLFVALVALTASMFAPRATAQNYTCFPTCSTTDGRFLSLAGAGLNAFAGDEIVIGLGLVPTESRLVLGIFDGETGGMWDIGTAPLEYTLYADPNGDGTDAVQIGQWSGTSMTDNGWYTINIDTASSARSSVTGNHVYYLHVKSTDTVSVSTSSFKIRTNGTITIKSHQSFSIYAPFTKVEDARVIYPNWGTNLDNPTYDGTWNIWLDVPSTSSKLEIWDGDMDHGAQDGSAMDTDDPNTDSVPSWATPAARNEGIAQTIYYVRNADGTTSTTIHTTGDPTDDNGSAYYRRSPSIKYKVYAPDTTQYYENNNPSGNLEWERYLIDTRAFDSTVNDAHADSLPAGMYRVQLLGMDMGNVNAWRFFNDVVGVSNVEVVGVDTAGHPVVPARAVAIVDGTIAGAVFYDSDSNSTQASTEPGIPSVKVTLSKTDGTVAETVETDATGAYTFHGRDAGTYRVRIDTTTLQSDAIEVYDPDGVSTRNYADVGISSDTASRVANFGYIRRSADLTGGTSGNGGTTSTAPGTGTRGYWVNHPSAWPDGFTMTINGTTYDKDALMTILQKPTKGDRRYALAAQLIAAELNRRIGNPATCIYTAGVSTCTVLASYAWLHDNNFPTGNGKTCNWSTGEPLHDMLDSYNNGHECDPHMN